MAIEYKTLEQLLAEQGLTMEALRDPGARFGYSKEGSYGQFFPSFNEQLYTQGISRLKELETSTYAGIESQFGAAGTKARTGLQSSLMQIQGMAPQTGLQKGATERLSRFARMAGAEGYEDIVQRRSQQMISAEESLGSQYGALTGLLYSFLGDIPTRALQVRQGDPTGAGGATETRLATQADIDELANRLPYDRESFMSNASSLVGQSYQSLLDLYGQYGQTNINYI